MAERQKSNHLSGWETLGLAAIVLAVCGGIVFGIIRWDSSVERTQTVMVCEKGSRQDTDEAFDIRTDGGTFDLHDATINGKKLLSEDARQELKKGGVYEITTSGTGFLILRDPRIEEVTTVDGASAHGGCGS